MYVNQNEAVNVYDLGLMLFRDEVLHHSLIRERLKTTLLAMVAQERRGEIVDRYSTSVCEREEGDRISVISLRQMKISIIPISSCRGAVKSTCKMLMELGIGSRDVYEDDFERPLLEESREFYRVS